MSLRDHLKYAMFYSLAIFLSAASMPVRMVCISVLAGLVLNMAAIILEVLDVSKKITMAMVLVSYGGLAVNLSFFLYEMLRYGS